MRRAALLLFLVGALVVLNAEPNTPADLFGVLLVLVSGATFIAASAVRVFPREHP